MGLGVGLMPDSDQMLLAREARMEAQPGSLVNSDTHKKDAWVTICRGMDFSTTVETFRFAVQLQSTEALSPRSLTILLPALAH